jgi:hypothetical protein
MADSKSKSAAGKVTAMATKRGAMKHNFAELRIRGAANGYTLHHEHPRAEGEKGMYMSPKVDEHVFSGDNAEQDMQTKLGEILGNGKAPGNKDDKTKSGKMDAEDKKDMGKNEKDDDEDDE